MPEDERDTMFARIALSKEKKNYEDYYSRNLGKKDLDDLLRSFPGPGSAESTTFEPLGSPVTDSLLSPMPSGRWVRTPGPTPTQYSFIYCARFFRRVIAEWDPFEHQ